jgi:hypothetical protein
MRGNDRVRHCGQCEKNVYNLSGMTRDQATALVTQNEGNLCVRFYCRADGTMLTQDCPVGMMAAVRKRVLLVAGVAVAFLFAAISFATAGGFVLYRMSQANDRQMPEPLQTVLEWIFPPTICIQGMPLPVAPPPVVAPQPGPNDAPPAGEGQQ